MNPMDKLDPRLLETLSAYLDGRLESAEKAALEARLNKEESLRRELAELRSVRDSLRALPLLKPPRSLALSPAMAGKATGKSGVFSPRRMALGSALASLAFVCVLSIDVLSRGGFLAASTAPQVFPANESFAVPRQSVDSSGAGKSAATAAPASPMATETPSPTARPLMGGGCGGCAPTEEESVIPPQVVTVPMATVTQQVVTVPIATVTQPSALPDFQTVAPYLEALLVLAAVLLAASAALAAIIVRRRR
jgi:hypothetical protein